MRLLVSPHYFQREGHYIAKAELQALNLSRELIITIQTAWKCPFTVFRVFVDSMVVYHWVKMKSSRLGIFHMNRVQKIQELKIDVKCVYSEQNGADQICKTNSPDYCKSDEFLRGKPWIRQPDEKYPDDGRILSALHTMEDADRKAYLDGFRSQQISVSTAEVYTIEIENNPAIFAQQDVILRGRKKMLERFEPPENMCLETHLINILKVLAVDSNVFFQLMNAISSLETLLT